MSSRFLTAAAAGRASGKPKAPRSLMTYVLFIVFLVLVLVIAFTYYMKRRMK